MPIIKQEIPHLFHQKIFAALWLFTVISCSFYSVNTVLNGYTFDSSIVSLLPIEHQVTAKQLAEKQFSSLINKQLTILLESESQKTNLLLVKKIEKTLTDSQLFEQVIGDITNNKDNAFDDTYKDSHYQLLTNKHQQQLQENNHQLADEALGRLYSPLAPLFTKNIINDPLQLFWQWQTAATPKTPLTIENNWLTRRIDNKEYYVFRATLTQTPFDTDYQTSIISVINSIKKALPSNTQLLHSGLLFHAAHGAKQAKQEMSTIGIGSIIGIVLLLLLCFRRILYIFLAFIPIISGCLIASTLSLLLFDKVHLITLAFGATLVGVAIDYPLHYICANLSHNTQLSHAPRSTLRKILPSLSLGLLSSVIAYSAQGIAPFPGLRQMAFFSATGLIGGWLTVICWMPFILREQHHRSLPKFILQFQSMQKNIPSVDNKKIGYFFILLTFVSLSIIVLTKTTDDIRALQTSPQSMLAQDMNIRKILGDDHLGVYFTIEAKNEQALLQQEEQFLKSLTLAINKGIIARFMATSIYLPSINQQIKNNALIKKAVYQDGGLLDNFLEKSQLQSIKNDAQQAFNHSPIKILSPQEIFNGKHYFFSHLWLGEYKKRYYSIITLHGDTPINNANNQYLRSLAKSKRNIHYVNRVDDLSLLLKEYKLEIIKWLVIAYFILGFILTLRYKKSTWKIIAVPALASLLSISILILNGTHITIFHYFSLLLILGIGLDTSIFLYDHKHSAHTWLAVILSTLTTLLAFGLLSFSQTPVLQYFGETVLIGIFFVLILSPFFTSPQNKSVSPYVDH